ncbi:hypothetical protein [Chryseobacterium pennipullorum]|uniref:Nuclear transport factor 2 family protein n=1 Tax=Chryseobacterium pennipullorum TaxID=2258963 RepID=A0A3D9AWG1_9FLAO|nr:hypothetical protein [Chryseobacterium pennipullorum]REC45492.1 hypothetical protein DRF67_16295 [Chryseobacterium pennipullorum]
MKDFFEHYAELSMIGNADRLAQCYADQFMVGEKETAVFRNDEKFIEWLNGVFAANKKAGMQSLRVKDIVAVQWNESFVNARVTWSAKFLSVEEEMSFVIHYVVNVSEDHFKIVLYISEQDEEQVKRGKGLI